MMKGDRLLAQEEIIEKNEDLLLSTGFHIKFVTMNHNSPLHWHRAIEILYILNGNAIVNIENEKYCLKPLDFIVIDSSKVHDVIYGLPQTMGICIHISKNFMRRYIPDIELLHIKCYSEKICPQQQKSYNELCEYMKDLIILYVNQTQSYNLRSNALVLQILANLIDYYSIPVAESITTLNYNKLARMEQICDYVQNNYKEIISLQQVSDTIGLNKEYFCRFFKQNMGLSFLNYVQQIRINHIYHDLIQLDDSIQEIIEKHGFTNQKLFYRKFKETYSCTPRQLRTIARNNPYI